MVGKSIEDQTARALRNVEAVLAGTGCRLANVVNCTAYLAQLERDWDGFDAAYRVLRTPLPGENDGGCAPEGDPGRAVSYSRSGDVTDLPRAQQVDHMTSNVPKLPYGDDVRPRSLHRGGPVPTSTPRPLVLSAATLGMARWCVSGPRSLPNPVHSSDQDPSSVRSSPGQQRATRPGRRIKYGPRRTPSLTGVSMQLETCGPSRQGR